MTCVGGLQRKERLGGSFGGGGVGRTDRGSIFHRASRPRTGSALNTKLPTKSENSRVAQMLLDLITSVFGAQMRRSGAVKRCSNAAAAADLKSMIDIVACNDYRISWQSMEGFDFRKSCRWIMVS
jgi:hypothetical protein